MSLYASGDLWPTGTKKRREPAGPGGAALELFATKGFDATTIDEIAEAVEVSPRTFFRYFASKEEVLFAEEAGSDGDLAAFLAARPSSESSLEKLQATVLGWTADYEQDRERLLRRAKIAHGTPSLAATALAHWQAKEEVVVAALLAADPRADAAETRLIVAVSLARSASPSRPGWPAAALKPSPVSPPPPSSA